MPKSKKSGMITMSVSDILNSLQGTDALNIMYTIRYCVLESVKVNSVIDCLKKLKGSLLIEWNTCSISDCAIAALHLLEIETYNGNKPQILDMISTRFFSGEKLATNNAQK